MSDEESIERSFKIGLYAVGCGGTAVSNVWNTHAYTQNVTRVCVRCSLRIPIIVLLSHFFRGYAFFIFYEEYFIVCVFLDPKIPKKMVGKSRFFQKQAKFEANKQTENRKT